MRNSEDLVGMIGHNVWDRAAIEFYKSHKKQTGPLVQIKEMHALINMIKLAVMVLGPHHGYANQQINIHGLT